MCHGAPLSVFPEPYLGKPYSGEIEGFVYESQAPEKHIAILPDIFGPSPLYQGLALHLAEKGARVTLIDPYSQHGALEEATTEHAFARRGKLKDKTLLDSVEAYCNANDVTGIIGFCLGGLYIFELARRNVSPDLVGLYGFPQGLPNQDPIPVPFDYLDELKKPFTMMMGGRDEAVTKEVLTTLSQRAPQCAAMDLIVYPDADHGFIADLDSEDPNARGVALDALERLETALL